MPRNASSVVRVNGIELGYRDIGEGDPLILLHGGFGSVEMFGPNLELLAAGRRVIGVDLQSHGRSPAADRPMRFEAMADDIAALIRSLGFDRAAIMGFSLGGAVGLRTAIQDPDLVERLVLVSTVFKRQGWYPEMTAGMDAMGPETAGFLMQSPMYEAYQQIAPQVEDWPVLVRQLTELLKVDYDWSAEIPGLSMRVMLVIGDADGIPPRPGTIRRGDSVPRRSLATISGDSFKRLTGDSGRLATRKQPATCRGCERQADDDGEQVRDRHVGDRRAQLTSVPGDHGEVGDGGAEQAPEQTECTGGGTGEGTAGSATGPRGGECS